MVLIQHKLNLTGLLPLATLLFHNFLSVDIQGSFHLASCLLLFYMMVFGVQQEQRSLLFPLGLSEATENNELF